MVIIDQVYDVEFIDMTHDGMGVCRIDNFPIFVDYALKGEQGRIKVTKVSKTFGFGVLVDLKLVSPHRKEPVCDHFYECGGCDLMHMNYQMQLNFKKHRVSETLKRLGKIDCEVNDVVGMGNPYYYRNKSVIPFGYKDDKMVCGLYKRKSHEIISFKKCFIIPKYSNDIVNHLRNLFTEKGVSAYDETTKTGLIRHVIVRNSYKNAEVSVTIVTTSAKIPHLKNIIEHVINRYTKITTVIINVNDQDTNVILGKKSKIVYGNGYITDHINDLVFKISHRSFYQVNPVQTQILYNKAIELADLKPTDNVIDAYCGIGTITLNIARHVNHVYGVEVVKQAINDANENAEANKIKNVTFKAGKAETVINEWSKLGIDVVFVDPPRKGCEKSFLDTIINMGVKKIVYISCKVATLARDLNILQAAGYECKTVTPVDMFPQTAHIETIALIEKREE